MYDKNKYIQKIDYRHVLRIKNTQPAYIRKQMDISMLSLEQRYAFEQFKRRENLFITGPGGTGKTKLIEFLVHHLKSTLQPYQVCALTGCAAILLPGCNARTIHSWSGIRLAKGPKNQIISNILKNKNIRSTWRKVKVLIVDEVSMMSKKIFELLEEVARSTRLSTLPFGGIQVIFTGDFYQLPPVGNPGEPDTEKFCFQSPAWTKVFPRSSHIELKTMFRQTDPLYRDILGEIRTGSLTQEHAQFLQGYVKRPFDPASHGLGKDMYPTKLFPTRMKTDFLNHSMFSKLPGKEYDFACETKTTCRTYLESNTALSLEQIGKCSQLSQAEIDYEVQQLMTSSSFQEHLALKVGAVVMCTVNLDMDNGIVNGSQGVVQEIVPAGPIVQFVNGMRRLIPFHFRQSEEYPAVAVGQIPLCLAWALTIHKIQGATLSLADMDVGGQIFEYGQTYVALSRVQSLDGLYLSAFQPQRIRANEAVKQFYQEFPVIDYEAEVANMTKDVAKDATNLFEQYAFKEPVELVVEEYAQAKPSLKVVKQGKSGDSPQIKEPTSRVSFTLFAEGKSVQEISQIRGLKPNTIMEHVLQCLPDERVQVDRFMTEEEASEIKACFDVVGPDVPLKMIKDSVSDRITYDMIKAYQRICFAFVPRPVDPTVKKIVL